MTDRNQMEILPAEDNPQDGELTLRALSERRLANPVRVASDGAAALEILLGSDHTVTAAEAALPRFVLLDLKLPKVDGLQVLRRIKSDPRTRAMPVRVLTSSREEPDLAACYAHGVNSYIVKPVDFEAFAGAVAKVGLHRVLLNQQPG